MSPGAMSIIGKWVAVLVSISITVRASDGIWNTTKWQSANSKLAKKSNWLLG